MSSAKRLVLPALAVISALAIAGCSSHDAGSGAGPTANISQDQAVTGTARSGLTHVTWYGDYRPLLSLDPIAVADYPEETVLPNICEPMLRVTSANTIVPGAVTATQVSPTKMRLTLRPGVTFSDGTPVKISDVVFTLQRNMGPKTLSNYSGLFTNVQSIAATGASEATITFKVPDVTFENALATEAGAIVSKAFVTKAGQHFGSPNTGLLCTGPYTLTSYDGTSKLVMTRSDHYWDASHRAKVKVFTFVFPADPSALANGLTSGEIDGAMDVPSNLLETLQTGSDGKVFIGGEGSTPMNLDVLMTDKKGPLNNPLVRQALSLALDRKAIAEKIYNGTADPLYWLAGPGLWGYGQSIFAPDYAKQAVAQDIAKAKSMIEQAHAKGASATFGYPSTDPQSVKFATILQQTAQSIGLDLQIKGVPLQQYGSLFVDPAARAPYDAILTRNYTEHREPAIMDEQYALPGGQTNLSNYSNATVTSAIRAALAEPDTSKRARLILTAQHQLDRDLPSIPVVAPRAVVFQGDRVTGVPLNFSFTSSAWAARVGAP